MPKILIIFIVAWVIAQGSKFFLELHKDKNVKFRRVISESGGMPSSHSAVVVAISTFIGFSEGIHSAVFGLSFIFAMIVIYDSMKVRYSNGKQAEAINNIIEASQVKVPVVRIVRGHTPLEVAAGTAIGLLIGYLVFIFMR